MAYVFGRLIRQALPKARTKNVFPSFPRNFHSDPGRRNIRFANLKTSTSTSTKSAFNTAGFCVTLGLGGALLYRYQKQNPNELSNLLVVRADECGGCNDSPCGQKKNKSPCGGKGKIKMSTPCKPRKKKPEPQPNVISGTKKYTLFLWITLEADADPCAVACAASQVEEAICATKGFDCEVDDEIIAGVGFGPNFLCQNCMTPKHNFAYRSRKGKRGEMPCSNGDILVHAKADSLGQLFDFCKNYLHGFPDDSVCEFEDLYGFSFRGNRDISGFMINQANKCSESARRDVALDPDTAGSYALAQKWVHDLCALEEDKATLECYIGKNMDCNTDICERPVSSHMTRVTGNPRPGCPPQYDLVHQHMSFGSLSEKAGCFFLGFSCEPCVFDWMLDRMMGANCDDPSPDDVMRISKNVKGTYFYFPGMKELEGMKGGCA